MGATGRPDGGEILSRLLLLDIIRCEVSAEAPSFRTKHREVGREELSYTPRDGRNDSITLDYSQQIFVVHIGVIESVKG